jgi:hypothetical protein
MSTESSGPQTAEPSPAGIAEELPPVTPPSAGFIIQLFLIPALIVAAVIAVWGLFGQLASSDVDLERVVVELGNNNEHRRWRAAHNLYVLLQNGRHADQNDPARLSARRDIAEGLTGLLRDSLDSPVSDESSVINHQVFLARTMGSLESDDLVLPALAKAMQVRHEKFDDVRKSAMMSLALIAARHFGERTGMVTLPTTSATPDLSPLNPELPLPLSSPTIDNEDVLAQLTIAAQDSDPSIRHVAAYVLGLVSGPHAIEQLQVLLLDGNESTKVNAAIALSRNGEVSGIPTVLNVLREGSVPISSVQSDQLPTDEQQDALAAQLFDQSTALVNCLTAVGKLWNRIDDGQKTDLRTAIQELESGHASPGIRLHATAVLRAIQ